MTSKPVFENSPPLGDAGAVCPDCGAKRRTGAKFCEICRYSFETCVSFGAGSSLPVQQDVIVQPEELNIAIAKIEVKATDPVDAGKSSPLEASVEIPVDAIQNPVEAVNNPVQSSGDSGAILKLEAVVRVDESLYEEPDPELPCPTDEPERIFHLDLAENLIGRRSDKKDIHPEIPLNDPGVSHRHAKLLRQTGGGFILLDLGSANGTELNGKLISEGVRTPIQTGDEITLGCWTRILLREQTL